MERITKFKVEEGNNYIYNPMLNRFQFCHPILDYIIKLNQDKIDVKKWLNNIEGDFVVIGDDLKYSKQDILYYYRKFLFLSENGFFSNTSSEKEIIERITGDKVKKTLANTRQVTFEVTDACNLKCEYCGYGKFYDNYDRRGNKNLSIDTAKNMLKYLARLWNSSLNVSHDSNIYISFYGGEPLLNFSFIEEIVNFAKELNLTHNRFTFSMTTNGILLEKYINFFADHNFNILVSLDGDEKNNEYRVYKNGKPSYQKLIKILKMVEKKYPNYFKSNINFNAVLHNKNTVAQIYDFFKKNFGKYPSIGELNNSGIKDSQKEKFLKTYSNINESLYQCEHHSEIEKELFIRLPGVQSTGIFLYKYSGCFFSNYNQFIFPKNNQIKTITGTCYPFSKKIFLTVNGKILPCERVGHQYAMGFFDENIVDIDFDGIAAKYNDYFDKLKNQCSACYSKRICRQCIFHLNIEEENPVCNGFMTYHDFKEYLSSHFSNLEKNPGIYSRIMKEVLIE